MIIELNVLKSSDIARSWQRGYYKASEGLRLMKVIPIVNRQRRNKIVTKIYGAKIKR